MDRDAVRRMKDLEKQNARLKRLVADPQLDIQTLKEIAKGNSEPGAAAPPNPYRDKLVTRTQARRSAVQSLATRRWDRSPHRHHQSRRHPMLRTVVPRLCR